MYGVDDDMFDDYMPDMIGAGSSSALDDNSEIIESGTSNIYNTPKVSDKLCLMIFIGHTYIVICNLFL